MIKKVVAYLNKSAPEDLHAEFDHYRIFFIIEGNNNKIAHWIQIYHIGGINICQVQNWLQ